MVQQPSDELIAAQKAIQTLLNKEYPDQVLVDFVCVTFSVSTDMDTLEDRPKYQLYSNTSYPHVVAGLLDFGVEFFEDNRWQSTEDEDD